MTGLAQDPCRGRWRVAAAAAVAFAAVLAGGCKEVQDAREELGWSKQREAPPPPPVVSLASHWIPADGTVADVGQAQWSARWWQWTGRFADADAVPYRDPDGRHCAEHQDGPVWFLAGTDGNFEAVRKCRIPADKHLFVPLINWVVARGLQGVSLSCGQKQAQAADLADHVTNGLVLLDGRPVGELGRMRVASDGCFSGLQGGQSGASDGYWLMLKPLPPGTHQLAISAAYRDGPRIMLQNFRYELDVEGTAADTANAASAVDAAGGVAR